MGNSHQRRSVLSEPTTGPAMKLGVMVLVLVAMVSPGEPEPHYSHHPYSHHYVYHYPYHHPVHHHVKGEGVAKHPGGATSYVAPQVHGLGKRSADPSPVADPEPEADADPTTTRPSTVTIRGQLTL